MDKYEQEMFNFLTIEENLKGLIIAKNQFNNVRVTLIKNFWLKVYGNLFKHFENSNRWEVRMDSNIFNQYSKLYLLDKNLEVNTNEHPLIFFCWERLANSYPYYGICTNKRLNEIDRRKVFDIILEEKSSYKNNELSAYEKSNYWPLWRGDSKFDMSDDQTLLQLTPIKQDELAKQFSDQLIELFDLLQCAYDKILLDCESIKQLVPGVIG